MTTPLGIALNTVAAQLGTLIETIFPDVCSISRPTFTLDAYGGTTPSYATVVSSIGCAWAPAGKDSREYVRALQITGVAVYMITMPANIDVKPKDRIVVEARGDESERTFEVKGPALRNAGLPLSVLCTLEEQ
jgi:hypothetical protein